MSENKIQVHICGSDGWGIGSYRMVDDDGTESMGYGFYRPENPHDFFPDYESCSPEEIAAHKAACEEWDRRQSELEKGEK